MDKIIDCVILVSFIITTVFCSYNHMLWTGMIFGGLTFGWLMRFK